MDYVNPQNVDILRPYVNELRRNTNTSSTSATPASGGGQSSRSRPRERRNHEAPPRRSHQEPPSRVRQAAERRAERRRSSPRRRKSPGDYQRRRSRDPGHNGRRSRSPLPTKEGSGSSQPATTSGIGGGANNGVSRENNSRRRSRDRSASERESGERASSCGEMDDEEDDDDILRSPTPVDIAQRPPSPPGSCHSELSPDEDVQENLDNVRELADVARLLPVVWSGVISLKSSDFGTMMHLINGCVDVVDNLMRDHTTTEMARVRITHRLRLDDSKLKDIERRITDATPDCLSILLALPNDAHCTGAGGDSIGGSAKPLASLVDYLRNKHAAGVISVDSKHCGSIIHTFPPCPFADKLIMNRANCVSLNPAVDNYIVVVVIKDDDNQ